MTVAPELQAEACNTGEEPKRTTTAAARTSLGLWTNK